MRTRILLACAMTSCAGIVQAQAPQASLTPQVAFDRFLRMAATVGQPVAALRPLLPAAHPAGAIPARYSLSAAHTIVIGTGSRSGAGDSVVTVSDMTWRERVADTIALRRRVRETMQQLERIAGPVERCGDPFGAPVYLFAPQTVARVWRRGPGQQPTQLVWEVGAAGDYSISVTVGPFADNGSARYGCGAVRE